MAPTIVIPGGTQPRVRVWNQVTYTDCSTASMAAWMRPLLAT